MDAVLTINKRKAYVLADVDIVTIDDSFSHEFGIAHVCHEEVRDIEIIECYYMDTEEAVSPICKCIKEDILQALQDQLN
jgi:hypothetical protein